MPMAWLPPLADAFAAEGKARERLDRVARDGGIVVTTGQQPALFGGPIYTWSKAIAAIELAAAIERSTGVPTAPVYWAATDDADYAEAYGTWVALPGGARHLTMHGDATEGVPMAEVSLGDVSDELRLLTDAAGSTVDPAILELVRGAYRPEATVGGAFVTLLRGVLQPLGMAVLDASHPALLEAERPLLVRALRTSAETASALAERTIELRSAGIEPQVADVEGLSLVFTRVAGRKVRVPLSEALGVAAGRDPLSPNVLLRPVAERAVLPTIAYVAGPGELAYFAQVSAVAQSLGAELPLAVPRWSCTILEPQVDALLQRYSVTIPELGDVHAVERRLAMAAVPGPVLEALGTLRGGIASSARNLRDSLAANGALLDGRVVDGAERVLSWRTDRLERRVVAAAKRREAFMMRDVATMQGALYPAGVRQERALNLMPIRARHGEVVLDAMCASARQHADSLIEGRTPPIDET